MLEDGEAALHHVLAAGVGRHGEIIGIYGFHVAVIASGEVGPPAVRRPGDRRHVLHLLVGRYIPVEGAGA
jgi:hypothetical protein